MDKQFKKDLDQLVRNSIGEVVSTIKKHFKHQIFKINFEMEPDQLDKVLIKYFKNNVNDINVLIELDAINRPGEADILFYYKGKKVEGQGYYVLPKNYKPVSNYKILQECIKQDTNTPDIKYLEIGEKK